MEQAQQLSTEKKKLKPGPKPKAKAAEPPEFTDSGIMEFTEKNPEMEQLKERINMLESCLERVATLTGNGNILMAFGLKRWIPGKSDLSKYNS